MTIETEALKQFFAAINSNDMQAVTRDFDPQIVRIEPEGFPTAGTYRGIAQVLEHIIKGRGTWAEGSCEPEKYLVNGDKVVVYLRAWVRLKGSNDWSGGRFADGFVFRHGRITRYLSFAERVDALKWAGIAEDMTAPNNLFNDRNPPAKGERFDTLLAHRNLVIERIVSGIDIQPVEYKQAQDEWVLLVQGAATMDVAGARTVLGAGDCLFLPADTPHRVESCEPGTLWLAVHLHPE